MKVLSLKLENEIFEDTEEITSALSMARNRYINEAVKMYNLFNRKKLIRATLLRESKQVSVDSMNILHEFEKLIDETL